MPLHAFEHFGCWLLVNQQFGPSVRVAVLYFERNDHFYVLLTYPEMIARGEIAIGPPWTLAVTVCQEFGLRDARSVYAIGWLSVGVRK
jgi:hypothetical protein